MYLHRTESGRVFVYLRRTGSGRVSAYLRRTESGRVFERLRSGRLRVEELYGRRAPR